MGCITAYADYLGSQMMVGATATPTPSVSLAYAGGTVTAKAECLPTATASAAYIGSQMRVEASLVCTLADLLYLDVSKDVIWLTPENYFEDFFEITSNTDWLIK